MAQIVKNLPAIQETWVQSLGREGSLEKETDTCLENPMDSTHSVCRLQFQSPNLSILLSPGNHKFVFYIRDSTSVS